MDRVDRVILTAAVVPFAVISGMAASVGGWFWVPAIVCMGCIALCSWLFTGGAG